MTRRRLAPTFALLALAFPGAASARMTPCVPGQARPLCHVWNAKVTFVGDGDTIYAKVPGAHKRRIRITGINAQELRNYDPHHRRGECHGVAATKYLERMIRGSHRHVRLLAQHPGSHSGSRPRRSVRVKLHGRWRDVGTAMLRHGDVLWLPNAREWAWNGRYSGLAERAAARGQRLWSKAGCGRGPRARLRLWVNWQGHADAFTNVPGEWVRIKNLDFGRSVSLARWVVRTSDLRRYRFVGGVRVPAGGELTVHVDRGRNTATDRFWGLGRPVFDNVSDDARKLGDGAYLFDPRGNMRAHMQYPCRFRCSDPLRNRVAVGAAPGGADEYATITNVSAAPVNLEGYQVGARVFNYSFGPGSVLSPGQTMRVYVDGSPADDTPLVKHAGLAGPLLPNRGDRIQLRTYDDIRVACQAWGDGTCSR